MGTPDFAVPVLEGLIENYQVIGVVSQPDKKVGRKQKLSYPPVKECALKNNIAVMQPEKIKQDYEQILKLKPDIIITCAYGQIIPKILLDLPPYGCINVHASLLPKLRGGAPIHKAIIEGYKETGITIMYMDEKMDSGDIISQKKTSIDDEDTLKTLHDRLSLMGKELLLETLPEIFQGTNQRIKQKEEEVTYASNIKREEEHIDFNSSAKRIYNQIRGLNPTPGAYIQLDDQIVKVYQSRIGQEIKQQQIGEIINLYKDGIGVRAKDREIILTQIKPFGKKKMEVKDYLNGVDKNKLIGKKLN